MSRGLEDCSERWSNQSDAANFTRTLKIDFGCENLQVVSFNSKKVSTEIALMRLYRVRELRRTSSDLRLENRLRELTEKLD